jgi:hypothetical protein
MGSKVIVITGASGGSVGARPGTVVQTPEQVAAAITALIDHPQAEVYTNPGTAETVARYYADVGAFEQAMGP